MPEPLARDEDRAADVEAERVVLERRPVPVAHQESDQARVCVVDLVAPAGEADPRRVHHREVVGHRRVEPDEAVVEDGMPLSGITSLVTATSSRLARSSDGGIFVGSSGWSYPTCARSSIRPGARTRSSSPSTRPSRPWSS